MYVCDINAPLPPLVLEGEYATNCHGVYACSRIPVGNLLPL